MALLDEIGTFLQSAGIGTVGTDLFLSQMPPSPDDLVAVLEYAGQTPVYLQGEQPAWERPRIQVLVRNTTYANAYAKALAAFDALAAVANQTLTGTYYLSITPVQSPFLLRRDDSARIEVACNYAVQKAVS